MPAHPLSQPATPATGTDANPGKALALAALRGDLVAVRAALAAGADLNHGVTHQLEWNVTPLMLAAETGHLQMVALLLDAGADLKPVTKGFDGDGGWTAVMKAAKAGHSAVVQLLIQRGASLKTRAGKASLLEIAIERQNAELFAWLLERKADPNARGSLKRTPLFIAVSEGSPEFLEALLQAGANVDAQDECGNTALSEASRKGNVDIVRRLLAAGANVHLSQTHGIAGGTALIDAAIAGSVEVVELLLKAGANINHRLEDGRTALDFARWGEYRTLARLLLEAGAKPGEECAPPAVATDGASGYRTVERPDMGPRSEEAGFRQAVADFAALADTEALPLLDGVSGGASFELPAKRLAELVRQHHTAFLARGCFLFEALHERRLGLLPTADKYEAIAFMQTNGTNYDLGPGNIIDALRTIETEQPFELYGVSFDFLSGRLAAPPKNARHLAKQFYEVCPDFVDQGAGTVARAANELKKSGEFFLWWD